MSNSSVAELIVTSPAFEHGGLVPARYTCQGEDASPPIAWEWSAPDGAPAGTQSFLLIAEDRDIPFPFLRLFTWVHWIVYNIPPQVHALPAALPHDARLENGAQQGWTSFRRTGYGGPCPPVGTHRYHFTLYALDTTLDLPPRAATKRKLLGAIQGHVLAQSTLMGRYKKE